MSSMGSRRTGRLEIFLLMFVLALGTAACGSDASPGSSGSDDAGAGVGGSGLLQSGDVLDDAAAIAPGPTLPDPGEGGVPPYERTTPVAGRLATGAPTGLAPTTIGSEGGTVEAVGLRIEIPTDTLTTDTTFAVTSAPISSADFGGLVRPVTPLYRDRGRRRRVREPRDRHAPGLQFPDDATAMAF